MSTIVRTAILILLLLSLSGCVGYAYKKDGAWVAKGVGVHVSAEPSVRVGFGVFEKRYFREEPPQPPFPYCGFPPAPSLYPPFPTYYFVPPFPFHANFGLFH
jgi:hypothetical protein